MNEIILKYGKQHLSFRLPEGIKLRRIEPKQIVLPSDALEIVKAAIRNPLPGTQIPASLKIRKVAIGINDKTRPVPHNLLLPPLLDYLNSLGITSEQITFVIATGTHQPMLPTENHLILPEEIYAKYRVVSHDCDVPDLVSLGVTSFGTSIYLNRIFADADLKIVVGNIEPHHFMGFSGGNKTAAIGLTGRSTINHNHSFLTSDFARTGEVDQNPCRLDVEEMGAIIGTQLALNAILSSDKRIIHCLFGHPNQVMQHGIPISRDICQVQVEKKFKTVIASAGGYPKDINLYQAQKAITNAVSVTEDGGVIYLFAECMDGTGSISLEKFISNISSPSEALQRFQQDEFRIGPHKAYQLAKQANRVTIKLITSMDPFLSKKLFCYPISMKEFEHEIQEMNYDKEIAILPDAVTTIPFLYSSSQND